ncbi:unnamed protein product [Caenorhabditis brenneri]
MAETSKNRAKALEELIAAMKWLQAKNEENNLMETVFKGYSTPGFKGTDQEMKFLVEVLEESKEMKAQIEKEQMMHLETINKISTNPIQKKVLLTRARLNGLTHDTNLEQLEKEIRELHANLATVTQEHTEKINKLEAEHREVLAIYQAQLDEALAQIHTLEYRLNSKVLEFESGDRLEELWRENQALAWQLDGFRDKYLKEKAKKMDQNEAKPKYEQKIADLTRRNRELMVKLNKALAEAKNDKQLFETELELAMEEIRKLQLTRESSEDGWKVVDVEEITEDEVYTLCSDEFQQN